MGNDIGSFFVYLPLQIKDPVQRLQLINRKMAFVKMLPEPRVNHWLSRISLLSDWVMTKCFNLLSKRIVAVVTNVRGPIQELVMEGRPIVEFCGFVPPPNGVGMGICISSYARKVGIAISTDENVIPDPDLLIEFVEAEIGALLEHI